MGTFKKITIGNDFKLILSVYRLNSKAIISEGVPEGAEPIDLTDAQNISLVLCNSKGYTRAVEPAIDINILTVEIPMEQQEIGAFYVVLYFDKVDIEYSGGLRHYRADWNAFEIVAKTACADSIDDVSLVGVIYAGKDGTNGKSNYELAVYYNGFIGTEAEYVEWTRKPSVDAAALASTAAGLANTATINANSAASNANDKATLANNAATNADAKAGLAETAASNADIATGLANEATINANNAASNADSKATLANNAATNADSKSQLAETAASNASTAAGLANAATANANNAASNADSKATLANNAATNADNKAGLADQKATLANDAAIAANTATGNANTATTNANNAALAANSLAGTYNVTVAMPLGAGLYYNSATARAAVPTANRLLGRVITYATASGAWITEKFIGTDVANWTVVGNWERVPDNSQLVQLGADVNEINNLLADYTHTANKTVIVTSVDVLSGEFTSASHGFVNGDRIGIVIEKIALDKPALYYLPGGITPNNLYYIVEATANTFKLSSNSGDQPIILSTNENLSLNMFHFEKPLSKLTITNIPAKKNIRIIIEGGYSGGYVCPNDLGEAVPIFYETGKPMANRYSVISGSRVYCNADIYVSVNKGLFIKYSLFRTTALNITGNTTEQIGSSYYSPKIESGDISYVAFGQAYILNDCKIKIYKV